MSTTTVRRKGAPKELKYLADLLKMFKAQGESIRITNNKKTWKELCEQASGDTFCYEYLEDVHELRISDKVRAGNMLSMALEKYQ
jgi:hypothetical protein